ncbi:MAG: MBOAT family O-acyltransferase [Rikenellaceae bacterium]
MKPIYALLLLAVSVTTYLCGRWISGAKSDKKRSNATTMSVILVLLPLFFFKYFNALNEFLIFLLDKVGVEVSYTMPSFMLPIGISFYTFMALGYLVDVNNEDIEVENNFGILALFISFFPLVLSGPIERAPHMLPQFKKKISFNEETFVKGLKLMLWGYFMKLCVADNLAMYINDAMANIDVSSGKTLLFASLLYPFQVYGDLGGYSLIAIGVAALLGFNVNPNFNRPFFSTSMSEFWRRWHMSLIKWLTDYIYTPISFSLRRYKVWGIAYALMLTFIISGLWHGATVMFVVWGVIQGVFLSIDAFTQNSRAKIEGKFKLTNNRLYMALTMIFVYLLFAFSQIFGNVSSLGEAGKVFSKIIELDGSIFIDTITFAYLAIFSMAILFFKDFRDEFFPKRWLLFENKNIVIRYASYIAVVVLILLFGVFDSSQFIYFQF